MKLPLKYRYIVIVIAVLLPRIAWFVLLGGDLPKPARDQVFYISMAGRVAEGEGISFSREMGLVKSVMGREMESFDNWTRDPKYIFGIVPVETPTAAIEPGYPILLAALFMITGPCTGAVFLLNSIFAILGAWAVWKLVSENWGEKQAMLATLIWSLYPYYIYYSAYAMTDMIHISLLPVIALLTLRSASKPKMGFAAGIATGILFLIRSTILFTVPLQLAWLFFKRRWRAALLLLTGFVLCCIPWVIRNYAVLGSPVLLPTKGSLNLWMRNNPSMLTIEGINIPDFIENGINRRDLLDYLPMDGLETELERSNIIMSRAREFVFANPMLFTYLTVVRAGLFLSPIGGTMENAAAKLAGILIYLPMLLIAIREAIRRRKDGRIIFLVCCFLLYLALHSIAHGGVRYRLPVDTILIVFTSLFIGRKLGWSEKKRIEEYTERGKDKKV
ncbi:MAG: glycosyltransferase family 39 protein [Candidatus Aegiribacteria sp.]|nr:glycosyltransferase family 39 protein [Candidatus Aegiribacteria sp.]